MPDGDLRIGRLARDLSSAALQVRKEESNGTTMLSFSASSETPIERWFGTEILSHTKDAVRMGRVKGGAVPILFNHDWDDPIGMVDSAALKDGRLEVSAHLFTTDRAVEVAKMIDGGLKNISVGYLIHSIEEQVKTNTYTATDWEPIEFSVAPVPADPSIGVDRAQDDKALPVRLVRIGEEAAVRDASNLPAKPATPKGNAMSEQQTAAAGATAEHPASNDGTQVERLRIRTVTDLCRQHKVDDKTRDEWIDGGITPDVAATRVLDILAERGKSAPQSASQLGMTPKEVGKYSLNKAIRAVLDKSWTNAGFELEAHRAIAQKLGRANMNEFTFFVPLEVQRKEFPEGGRRDMSVGTANAGGYLVETANQGFIDLLRNRSVVMAMGARRLTGLVGNLTIPKQTAAGTGYWLSSETTQITEGQPTLGQLALSPKTVGGYTEISRQLTLQSSPDAEQLVMSDLAQVIALAVDTAALNGSGSSGQPTGIIGTSGIGGVTGTSLAVAGIIEFQSDVASANALTGMCGYVTTPAVAGLLMARQRFSSTDTPLWEGNMLNGTVFGFKAMSSNQMPTADMLFGDFSQVVIGEWGVLELEVNPYADFKAGIVGVRAMYSIDVGVRIPAAFSLATSIT